MEPARLIRKEPKNAPPKIDLFRRMRVVAQSAALSLYALFFATASLWAAVPAPVLTSVTPNPTAAGRVTVTTKGSEVHLPGPGLAKPGGHPTALAPNTGYNVSIGGSSAMISPCGSNLSDPAGVLVVSY
jgi:hypothetical protein